MANSTNSKARRLATDKKRTAMETKELTLEDELLVLDWRDLAACRDYDPELFFPAGETGPAAEQIRQAKRICASCEVQDDCLTYAIETNQVSGVWGGLTEDERRPVRRRWLAERRRRSVA